MSSREMKKKKKTTDDYRPILEEDDEELKLCVLLLYETLFEAKRRRLMPMLQTLMNLKKNGRRTL